MLTTSLSSLAEQARRLTVQNSESGSPAGGIGSQRQPPLIAAQDPFIEPLLEAYADRLPAPIKERLLATGSFEDVSGGLAAAAVYEMLAERPNLQRRFLQKLALSGVRPGEVALTFAMAYSELRFPPTRTPRWHALDRHGLILQLLTATAIWVIRGLVFSFLAVRLGCLEAPWSWRDVLTSSFGLPFLEHRGESPWMGVALVGIGLWVGLEAVWVPWILERVRQLPANLEFEPPPLSWRADAFAWAWRGRCIVTCIIILLSAASQLLFA